MDSFNLNFVSKALIHVSIHKTLIKGNELCLFVNRAVISVFELLSKGFDPIFKDFISIIIKRKFCEVMHRKLIFLNL